MYACWLSCNVHMYMLYYVNTGLRVHEVAHDYQVQVSRYVTNELGFCNSYDTWHGEFHVFIVHVYTCVRIYLYVYIHVCTCICTIYMYVCMYILGTKNVVKELKNIAQGANKWEGINWWRELSDKRKYTNLYVYDISNTF